MFEDLNQKLAEVKERLREKERLDGLISKTRHRLEEEKGRLQELSSRMNHEALDVKRLEGISLTAMFHRVLGTQEDKLDKERQEFLAAKLKHDHCRASVASLEREIVSLNTRLQRLGDPESEYNVLLTEKEKLIIDEAEKRLIDLIHQIVDSKAQRKELIEALESGRAALCELDTMISFLKSAKGWGTFDLVGGGIIATAVKHSKLDKAKQCVHDVQDRLRRFHDEISDVEAGAGSDLVMEIDGFITFADYFFDGLIFDWVVQSKIHRSLNNTMDMHKRVSILIDRLQSRFDRVQDEIENLEKEKRDFIERKK